MHPSREQLRELFSYNPSSGQVIRIKTTAPNAMAGDTVSCVDHGYIRCSISGALYYLHRLIWIYMTGAEPETIDHINGKTCDNRWANLRNTDQGGNSRNSTTPINNKSGVCGVSRYKKNGKWTAQIKVNYKKIHLGYFDDIGDAIEARLSAEQRYGFHSNHGKRNANVQAS